jgi:hypothetical protein
LSQAVPDLLDEIDIWRLVTDEKATLHELETIWSIDDVSRAISTMELKSAVEKIYTNSLKASMDK